jgi:hypothetical protein
MPTFEERGCHVASVRDPYGCIVNCTHEAEWTPFRTHYFSENLVETGTEPGPLDLVARNSDHWTTEAVYFLLHNIHKFSSYLTGNATHLRSVARNSDH